MPTFTGSDRAEDRAEDGVPGRSLTWWLRSPELGGTRLAVVIVTVLAITDLTAGADVVLAGLMTVGPCLAAINGTPRSVAAVSAYSVGLLLLLSGPDDLWWTTQQLVFFLALLSVTGVSAVAAYRRQHSEKLLREALADSARSQARSEATSEFLSRVSHELRTPLNAILGYTQLLQRGDLTPDQHENVNQVMGAGRHLLALVDDVLALTASEAGRLSLSIEEVSVGDVVREAVELTTPEAVAAHVELDSELGDVSGWYVAADARRARQILLNLLSNAVKFNRPFGQVRVRAERKDSGAISITVSDSGPGIAQADLPKLFRPFERLDAGLNGVEGSGLGLALSRGLAEAMGGRLLVASSELGGAAFTVTLPGANAPAAGLPQTAEETTAPPPALPDRTPEVLYVEDNLPNLHLVQRILQLRPAWLMTHVPGGVEGLQLALTNRFDLILLDHNLPDLSGLEVLRQFRMHKDRADVPVVMVSADASPGLIDEAMAAGASRYLVKPFALDELLAILDEHTPTSGR